MIEGLSNEIERRDYLDVALVDVIVEEVKHTEQLETNFSVAVHANVVIFHFSCACIITVTVYIIVLKKMEIDPCLLERERKKKKKAKED